MAEQHVACPRWVQDEAAVSALLERLLDKMDDGVKPLLRINKKTVPELFVFDSDNNHYIWSLIALLQIDYQVLAITLERESPSSESYENAKVRLNIDKEDTLRLWLNRPKTLSNKQLWLEAVEHQCWDSEQQKQAARLNPLYYPQKTSQQLVSALLSAKSSMTDGITLRALSAKCFWGDSKFLDKRLDLLTAIFPIQAANIRPRQSLLNVYIPNAFSSVVFIENQDTFLMLSNTLYDRPSNIHSNLNNIAFVYCAGFRGAASRIRDEGTAVFSYLSATETCARNRFTHWWINKEDVDIQPYFWGDLDYSGLGILASLQLAFPGIQAWQLGYAAMVDYHHRSFYHPKSSAKKSNQSAPTTCGCDYADTVLLPLIKNDEYFLDQEVVDIGDLEEW